jgi:hypothetical protein
MKKRFIILVALAAVMATAVASGQNAPLRGVGLLALNASEPGSARSTLVEMPDGSDGGGSVGARALRGGDNAMPSRSAYGSAQDTVVPDELPPRNAPSTNPAAPAAATPKRPSYRWQSLVPGAIK